MELPGLMLEVHALRMPKTTRLQRRMTLSSAVIGRIRLISTKSSFMTST